MMALYKLCLVISTYFPHTIGTKGVTRCIEEYKSPPLSSLLPCDFFPVSELLQTHVGTKDRLIFLPPKMSKKCINSKELTFAAFKNSSFVFDLAKTWPFSGLLTFKKRSMPSGSICLAYPVDQKWVALYFLACRLKKASSGCAVVTS